MEDQNEIDKCVDILRYYFKDINNVFIECIALSEDKFPEMSCKIIVDKFMEIQQENLNLEENEEII